MTCTVWTIGAAIAGGTFGCFVMALVVASKGPR